MRSAGVSHRSGPEAHDGSEQTETTRRRLLSVRPRSSLLRAPVGKPPGPPESSRLGYQPALDGLRAVAIALIVGFHYFEWPPNSDLGTDLFFVLTGFLITQLLLEERVTRGRISLRRFYARRALRLLPALAVFLAVFGVVILTHAVGVWSFAEHDDRTSALVGQWVMGLTFTTNIGFALGWAPYADSQFLWSLGAQEQFYLVWPVFLAAVLARPRGLRIAAATALTALVAIIALHAALEPAHPWFLDGVAVLRFDSIFVGCLCAFAYRHFPALAALARRAWVWLPAIVVMAVIILSARDNGIVYDGRTDLFDVAAAVALLASLGASSVLGRFLATPPLVFIGRISYGIYLWNTAVLLWLERTDKLDFQNTQIAGIALTLALAIASYYLVEQPFLRKKWRLSRVSSHDVTLGQALHNRRGRLQPGPPNTEVGDIQGAFVHVEPEP